ncbi:MAG: NUDIX hydrolase [Clostridiales bacterium]|nr:NUDIX hydrolase [Clostridiales bacterium]
MQDYKKIDHKLIHKGHIIDYYEDTIQLPDGRTAKWDLIDHRGAAAIVPVDEDGNIIMVRQYRNPLQRYTLEIPAGGINPGEDCKTAAMRECEEETGYRAGETKHLIDIYTTVAFCNEKISIYYTNQLLPSKQHLDEDEFLNVERHSVEELTAMILTGMIQDAKTISAILAYKQLQEHIGTNPMNHIIS